MTVSFTLNKADKIIKVNTENSDDYTNAKYYVLEME
jgi:hypothetical protein